MKNALNFFEAILVCLLAGIIGSVFTTPAVAGWYTTLVKPSLNPPSWVFAPVWTTLFVLMGIALFIIWKNKNSVVSKLRTRALILFFVQLVLNVLWSVIFFGLHSPGGALIEIVVLWLAIAATIIAFKKISKPAAWLLLPYILWVSFATYLNFAIWTLN